MKRLILAFIALVLFALPVFAGDANWSADPVTSLSGRLGACKAYTFTDNAAVSLSTMYVTGWVNAAGQTPIGMLVSVETQDARISCGGGTPTATVGHLLASGSSFAYSMRDGESCKMIPKTAGSYPLVQLSPIYSK